MEWYRFHLPIGEELLVDSLVTAPSLLISPESDIRTQFDPESGTAVFINSPAASRLSTLLSKQKLTPCSASEAMAAPSLFGADMRHRAPS